MKIDLIQLSKAISYALRHAPWEYGLELDEEGWVSVEELLLALQSEKKEWENLSENDLAKMIAKSSKERHELKAGKIRALYGHSTPNKLTKEPAEPPEILYHGTSPSLAVIIRQDGLKPMRRHYVHLSADMETARQVGVRKSAKPEILVIRAKEAYRDGVKFYKGNEHVWLAEGVPVGYIGS